jgi:hypothetical protein
MWKTKSYQCDASPWAAYSAASPVSSEGVAEEVDGHEHERDGGEDLEVDERLHPDPTDAPEVAHPRDPGDHGAEEHRGYDHLDQVHERLAHRLQRPARGREEVADEDAQGDTDQDPEVDLLV